MVQFLHMVNDARDPDAFYLDFVSGFAPFPHQPVTTALPLPSQTLIISPARSHILKCHAYCADIVSKTGNIVESISLETDVYLTAYVHEYKPGYFHVRPREIVATQPTGAHASVNISPLVTHHLSASLLTSCSIHNIHSRIRALLPSGGESGFLVCLIDCWALMIMKCANYRRHDMGSNQSITPIAKIS